MECSAISMSASSFSASGRADAGDAKEAQSTRHEMSAAIFIGLPEARKSPQSTPWFNADLREKKTRGNFWLRHRHR